MAQRRHPRDVSRPPPQRPRAAPSVVLLEVGSARVTPYVERDLTSFVHDYLERQGQLAAFDDNRPRAVRCVHPLVTLIEKLDALHRRVPREDLDASTFVRHFEDAARIIAAAPSLPPLDSYPDIAALTDEMRSEGQIRQRPSAETQPSCPAMTNAGRRSETPTGRSSRCTGASGSHSRMPAP